MSKGLSIFLAFVVVAVVGLGIFAVGIIGTINGFVGQENGVKAQYDQNKNNYDNYVKKLLETAQVPDNYADDVKKVYAEAIHGRYGDKGSQAVFQVIKEQNPNLDASLYAEIQKVIAAGRKSFEMDQKMLIDKKRVYETSLQTFPNSLIASTLGYPRIDLKKYDIVTSDDTETAFNTKKAARVDIGHK